MPPSSGNKPGLPEVLFFIRNGASLLAAVARPWQASFRSEHFASPFDKAAALMESIIRRHPFVDGNKRTGTASALYLLSTFGYELEAEQKYLEDFAVSVALGELRTKGIAARLADHARKV